MKTFFKLTAVFTIVLVVCAVSARFGSAQSPSSPQSREVSRMSDIEVKFGMGNEFEMFLKNTLIPALKKGGVTDFSVWKMATFGKAGNYLFTSTVPSMSEFDNPSPVLKAVGQDGLTAIAAKMQELVASSRTFSYSSQQDLAIPPPAGFVPKLVFEVKASIAPGRDADYVRSAKPAMDVVKKTNVKGAYAIRVGLGGNPNEFRVAVLIDSFADLERFGSAFEKAAIEAKLPPMNPDIVKSVEYSVYRYMPELSIQAPAQ
jgi:hypothetical protein